MAPPISGGELRHGIGVGCSCVSPPAGSPGIFGIRDSAAGPGRRSGARCSAHRAANNCATALLMLRDPAVRVGHVAEDDRLRRAGLGAGRDDRAVGDLPCGPMPPASTRTPILPRSIRCTQYVHFSITPRIRTVTSGFFCILSVSAIPYSVSGPSRNWSSGRSL